MRPGPANPAPRRGYRAKGNADLARRLPRPMVHKAATAVVDRFYPRRRSSGMREVLIFLTVQVLVSETGVRVGHDELAARFGIDRTTVTRRLKEWRRHRLVDRRERGRHNVDVTWWAPSSKLLTLVGKELRDRLNAPKRKGLRKPKRANASQLHRSNLGQVAAPGRPEGGGAGRGSGQAAVGRLAEAKRTLPEPDKPDEPDIIATPSQRQRYMDELRRQREELKRRKLMARHGRAV